jgi:hypothetical protein
MVIKRQFSDKNQVRKETNANQETGEELMEFEQFVSHKPRKTNKKIWPAIIAIILIVVLAGLIYFLNQGLWHKEGKYKAVFLDNGQVYFAKIVREDSMNLYLDDVFYIQTQQQTVPAQKEGDQPQVVNVPSLVKRGGEIHQPQGLLQINRSKVVSIEEIGPNSEVMQEINRIKTTPVGQTGQNMPTTTQPAQ